MLENFILIIVLVFIDQITKIVAKNKLVNRDYNIKSFRFVLVKNYGFAMGVLKKNAILIKVVHLIAVIVMICFYLDNTNTSVLIPLSIILSGGFSNLLDRFLYGYVIDYLQISKSPIFNLADIYILLGVMFVFFYEIFLYIAK